MTGLLKDRAIGRWPGVLAALGVSSAYLGPKHGPCPMCGGKDRFRFDNKGGTGSYFCSQCGPGDGVGLLMKLHGWDFKETAKRIDEIIGSIPTVKPKAERSDDDKRQAMNNVWRSSSPVSITDPVGRYLNARTGASTFPPCLRAHPRLRYHDTVPSFYPAMIAMLTSCDGKPAILHRTYLTKDGRKADVQAPRRIMNGTIPKGCAVRLAPYTDTLGIAEGIETALSAARLFDVPCWAAVNANMLSAWLPPAGVQSVIVFGDNDDSFTGQHAAFALAHRIRGMGLNARVEIPRLIGQDWNDVHREQLTGAAA